MVIILYSIWESLLEYRDWRTTTKRLQNWYRISYFLFQHQGNQLESLRESTEHKNRIYEDIDKALQELEKANQKLAIDSKADKQKIDR